MQRLLISLLAVLLGAAVYGQTPDRIGQNCSGMPATQAMADSVKKGFRGLSVVDEKVIWISGQRGLVGRSTNGGKTFVWHRVKGYEKMDFRTLYAGDKKNAMIATAGTPAAILTTHDGGKNWSLRYESQDSAMFFDGAAFWDRRRGLIFGDPVNGRMVLMWTDCGGDHWRPIPDSLCPQLVEGEAAFAASGTTIRTLPNGHVYIATGGVKSRLWHSRDWGHHWEVFETPIIQGKASQGIFSIAFRDTSYGVIAGGDYTHPDDTTANCFVTKDGGRTWSACRIPPGGYRSSVEFVGHDKFVATGTNGTDESTDGGVTWRRHLHLTGGNTIKRISGLEIIRCGGAEVCKKGSVST